MPYAPGISWRVGENLAAGVAQLGQNIERYTERRRNEAQEAAALRKLLSIYDPNAKEAVATMGLGELRGAAQGMAVKRQMDAQEQQARLVNAQIANFNADNQRADAQAQERADMARRLQQFSAGLGGVMDSAGPTPGGRTVDDVDPTDVMRMAARSGVLGSPQVNELLTGMMRYGMTQQAATPFQPRVVELTTDSEGRPLERPVRVVQTGPNQSSVAPSQPDTMTPAQKAQLIRGLRSSRTQLVLALANPVNSSSETQQMLREEIAKLDDDLKQVAGPAAPVDTGGAVGRTGDKRKAEDKVPGADSAVPEADDTVIMTGPSGGKFRVPKSKVPEARKAGYK